MPPAVACVGDAKAIPSPVTVESGYTGVWTAAPPVEVPHDRLQVGGASALKKVTCQFTFTATQPPSPSSPMPYTIPVTVVLEPKQTKLTVESIGVLLAGDQKVEQGNTLTVASVRPLQSA
ncbi:MAG TPA: hypothetical protein VF520_13370 [Thermoleophilaceae bacterium]|jgi:hypothetical protein